MGHGKNKHLFLQVGVHDTKWELVEEVSATAG
jgi:hypothetical protein